MSEHTKEPWKADTLGGTTIWAAENGGACIADCGTSDLNGHVPSRSKDEERANARRIVACVNACAGRDIDVLEETGDIVMAYKLDCQKAEQQRDKLLDALKTAEAIIADEFTAFDRDLTAGGELTQIRAIIAEIEAAK